LNTIFPVAIFAPFACFVVSIVRKNGLGLPLGRPLISEGRQASLPAWRA
jgi:hypothetical protein